ncbi:hypothetical protein ACFP7A_14140 [Sporolactobacillus kofuensis]|uniref:Antitoxin n=1 Tax=Sporolactobacillus kofuensis TaxID=269672 RepID=A0ABW1WJ61_9BACL|nr:hypothetical protein [Sporolactobacillus kofuensis]MCO7177177.1 hypothetical protein [Sporolactobacillus kofuensis]
MNKEKPSVTTDTLNFLRHNVYNVSDLTRKNKLTEILQKFVQPTDEVFVIENAKNKEAKAAMIDLKYFEDLLRYKEAVDQAADQIIEEEAIKRLNDGTPKLKFTDAFSNDDFDFDEVIKESKD